MTFKIKPLTGDRFLDGMLQGSYWNKSSLGVSLSNGWNGETWSDAPQFAQYFSTAVYQTIKFTGLDAYWKGVYADPSVAYLSESDINLSIDSYSLFFNEGNSWALGFFPNTVPTMYAGDIYINTLSPANTLPSYEIGSQGFFILLHELGHALGLKHPHDDGDTQRPTFDELDISDWDFNLYTVMSYNDSNLDLVNYNPATPMILDVFALQTIYGVNTNRYMTDTNWTLTESQHYETIYDPGGVNRITLQTSNQGWVIQIPDQTIGSNPTPVGWAHLRSDSGLPETFYWLAGNYPIVNGSHLDDAIVGNKYSNQLSGGGGNDILHGGAGDDIFDQDPTLRSGKDQFFGGLGNDIYYINQGGDQIFEEHDSGFDTINLEGPQSFSMPANVEKIETNSGAAVSLTGNDSDNKFHLNRLLGRIDGGLGDDSLTYQHLTQPLQVRIQSESEISLDVTQLGESLQLFNIESLLIGDHAINVSELTQLHTLPQATSKQLISLYLAYFDRLPDSDGLVYWLKRAYDGMAIESIAESFYEQPESSELDDLSHEVLIQTAYQKLFAREPDKEGSNYWLANLESGIMTRPLVLMALTNAALSTTGGANDQIRINDLIELGSIFSLELGLNDYELARQAIVDYESDVSKNMITNVLNDVYQTNISEAGNQISIHFENLLIT